MSVGLCSVALAAINIASLTAAVLCDALSE